KQSEKEHHRPVLMALVYCGTIVVVLTLAAVALLSFFKWLSINPVMNFALGGLFVLFALSLFGMYDLELPSGLAQYTSAREGMGELVLTNGKPAFFTFDLVLGLCIALAFLCGLYLLGVYRLPYDTPSEHLGVLRLLFSFLFLGLAFYLLPGLFRYDAQGDKQR